MLNVLKIRSVAADDLPEWRVLWDGYNEFYGRVGPTRLPGEVTQTTWSRFLDPADPVYCIVAESGGVIVGIAHYLFHPSTTQPSNVCYLQDLFTSPDARGMGVGSALIQEVYSRAAGTGASRVYWQTHESNATARRLYDQVAEFRGFVVYSRQLQK